MRERSTELGFAVPSRALVWWSRAMLASTILGAVLLLAAPHLERQTEPITVPFPTTLTPPSTEAPMKLTLAGLGPIKIGMAWEEAVASGVKVVVDEPTCHLGRYRGALVAEGDGKVISITVQDPADFPASTDGMEVGQKDGAVVYVRAGNPGGGC